MLKSIAATIAEHGGQAFYVGGYVRNHLMGTAPDEDIDIEIYHMTMEELQSVLSIYGFTCKVGKSFPVLKISGHNEWDFTIPIDLDLTFAAACARRDFTINSMMMDIMTEEIIDLYNGRQDIADGVIRHTSPDVFKADPLRVYRAAYFAARFNFSIHSSTLDIMRQTDLSQVKNERIYNILRKLLLLAPQPSIGLRYMQITGILQQRHPLLFNLIGCEQSAHNHPEGDVWEHTLLVVDQAALLRSYSANPEALMFAALLHDVGKPATTKISGEKVTAYGHDVLGEKMARDFLEELTRNKNLTNSAAALIREHMHPILLYKSRDNVSDRAIRKLISRVNLKELLLIAEADFLGRHNTRDFTIVNNWFIERLSRLGLSLDDRIEPLVRGQDLLQLGMHPGPAYKKALQLAFEMQLAGQTKEIILQKVLQHKNLQT